MKNRNYLPVRAKIQPLSFLLVLGLFFLSRTPVQAQLVNFDGGTYNIKGVQILQDANNPLQYYYIPCMPRLSMKKDSTFELLCLKYICGETGSSTTDGGIFHALVQFDLPPEFAEELETELRKKANQPKAILSGPVPLYENAEDAQSGGAFKLISAILPTNPSDTTSLATKVIYSGHAPFTPGSKAAIAAKLNKEGAILLFGTFESGVTSDVSVAISGYYLAKTKAYNANIWAEMDVIYNHFSKIQLKQKDYSRKEIREVIDKLEKTGQIHVDVFDQSKALGVKADQMEAILDIFQKKLAEVMFDATTGWSREPKIEVPTDPVVEKGRQERGWLASTFGGADDTKYYTDERFSLKKRTEIHSNKFELNLAYSTVIHVPFFTSGNLTGLKKNLGKADSLYFPLVDVCNDRDMQKKAIPIQLDGNTADAFDKWINNVSVTIHKRYNHEDFNDVDRDVTFTQQDIEAGTLIKEVIIPKYGIADPNWSTVDYKVTWNFRGQFAPFSYPAGEGEYAKSDGRGITLTPPFEKKEIGVLPVIPDEFPATWVALVKVYSNFNGERNKNIPEIRVTKSDLNLKEINIFQDKGSKIEYLVRWYVNGKEIKEDMKTLKDTDTIVLTPPEE